MTLEELTAEFAPADGVDLRAARTIAKEFSRPGHAPQTGECYYYLFGIDQSDIGTQDLIAICAGLGINSVRGEDCPDFLSLCQFRKLAGNREIVKKWNRR